MRVMLDTNVLISYFAYVLVTGDKDFADVAVGTPAIVTPAGYVERFLED